MIDGWNGISIEPFEALLFDLDGTLVDTMPLHFQAYATVMAARGLVLAEAAYLDAVGAPARVAIPRFVASAGGVAVSDAEIATIHGEKKAAFAIILREEELPTLPTAEVLRKMRLTRPCGLVSSGNRDGVHAILDKLGWRDWFAAIITGDDVTLGKPNPDPFLMAARAIGVSPSNCLVFEDTVEGLESARRAGMQSIDVTRLPAC